MGKNIIGRNGYLDTSAIYEPDVNIYFILGQRADGKTYGFLHDAIDEYLKTGTPSAYVRRFDESLKKYMVQDLCKPHSQFIARETRNKWNTALIRSKRFYMASIENDSNVLDENPFLYCYSLNTWENSKGPDSGEFFSLIFDECVSTSKYLPNEYTAYENLLSTILRTRKNTRIILLGNPVNQICPYFDEYGIDVHKMKPGDICYRINSDGDKLKFVFVPPVTGRKTASIFKFRESSSITTGYWEFGNVPHVPGGLIKNASFAGKFNIIFKKQFAVCEFYVYNDVMFAFWRPGNGDKIIDDTETPTFTDIHIFKPNMFTAWNISNDIGRIYSDIVRANRQYFADNKTGNLVKMWYTEFVNKAGRFV